MNRAQKHTPKFWVVHDTISDDVIESTMHKSRDSSIQLFLERQKVGKIISDEEVENWWYSQNRYKCELVEVKLVGVE